MKFGRSQNNMRQISSGPRQTLTFTGCPKITQIRRKVNSKTRKITFFEYFVLELLQNTKETVAKEIESRKDEFEEELLSIERKLSLDQDRSRNGGSGDIRDRLGKVKSLDDSLEADEEEEGGFMSNRRVVERDGDNETNCADLRMTLKNDLVERIGKQREDDNAGRQVIVKNEVEVEEKR